jgi:hypothetical protein
MPFSIDACRDRSIRERRDTQRAAATGPDAVALIQRVVADLR